MDGTMKAISVRKTVSRLKTIHDHTFYFCCWFDPSVKIEEEFQRVRRCFDTFDVDCDHELGQQSATIVGRGMFAERNKIDVALVRSFLLDHGWTEQE